MLPFLTTDTWWSPNSESDVVIIPYGLEHTVSWHPGTHRAPEAICNASHYLEEYAYPFGCNPCDFIDITTHPFQIIPAKTQEALSLLTNVVSHVHQKGALPVVIGGEHTVTLASINALMPHHPDLVLVSFDAHIDLRNTYEGKSLSHACVMRRCLEHPRLSMMIMGARSSCQDEIHYAATQQHRLKILPSSSRQDWQVDEVVSMVSGKPLYISIDVDVFDPSIIPTTGTPEPDGLDWQTLNYWLQILTNSATVVGFDIVELSPLTGQHHTDFTCAKLIYELIAMALKYRLPLHNSIG